MLKKNSFSLGIQAEHLAISFLKQRGFSILVNRFRLSRGSDAGEIDIIAVNFSLSLLVFVEVKKRKSFNDALEAISSKQMNRIYNSAEVFLSNNPAFSNFDCRFDVIVFDDFFRLQYFENAWGF